MLFSQPRSSHESSLKSGQSSRSLGSMMAMEAVSALNTWKTTCTTTWFCVQSFHRTFTRLSAKAAIRQRQTFLKLQHRLQISLIIRLAHAPSWFSLSTKMCMCLMLVIVVQSALQASIQVTRWFRPRVLKLSAIKRFQSLVRQKF